MFVDCLADSEDGMVVLQALVEGTVLEVYLKGAKSGPDPAPLAELYVHQYGSEVFTQNGQLLVLLQKPIIQNILTLVCCVSHGRVLSCSCYEIIVFFKLLSRRDAVYYLSMLICRYKLL